MHNGMELHRYTGARPMMPWRGMTPQGHCGKCGQPSECCCCGCRECRKEAKELLVTPDPAKSADTGTQSEIGLLRSFNINQPPDSLRQVGASAIGSDKAFIGGGCCVTLAVEYAPSAATTQFGVVVAVRDSEGTTLIWSRYEQPGTGYRVHECIITTKPGATLTLEVANCTARVRWCEVFSC